MKNSRELSYLEKLTSGMDQRTATTYLSGYFTGIAKVHPDKTYTAEEVSELLCGLFEIGLKDISKRKSPEPTKAIRA